MKPILSVTIKNALLLAAVAFVCAAVVGGCYFLTQDRIAVQVVRQKQALFAEVIPSDFYNNDLLATCGRAEGVLGQDAQIKQLCVAKMDGKTTAYVFETVAPNGYSGAIGLLIAITPAGEVLGVRVTSHSETPGLGDKIELKHSNWILSFAHRWLRPADPQNLAQWAVKKEGGQFDQFTGATITPRAVVEQVKRAGLALLADLNQAALNDYSSSAAGKTEEK